MADKAYITPNVLKWARESARMTEETAAAKVSHELGISNAPYSNSITSSNPLSPE